MKIDHFRDTPHLPLGESSAVGVPLGEPVSKVATTSVERDDGVEAGVWECTPRPLAAPDRATGVLPFHPGTLHLHPGWR